MREKTPKSGVKIKTSKQKQTNKKKRKTHREEEKRQEEAKKKARFGEARRGRGALFKTE